jgi:hypothetical protein
MYVAVQLTADPNTFQSWPIHICPECGELLMIWKENVPTFCPQCEDGTPPFIPLGAEEGEKPLVAVRAGARYTKPSERAA